MQRAFSEGNASIVIPIQQIPQQIAPVIIYFFIYNLAAPTKSFFFLGVGIILVVFAGFILSRRQAELEKVIKN
jgi:hypothetical protein